MDKKLETRLKDLLKEEGFADVHTESTDSSIVVSARKEHLMAYFQIAEGVPAKGAPMTRYIPGPEAPVHDAETRAPSVRLPAAASR
jgi:hypothetical protein